MIWGSANRSRWKCGATVWFTGGSKRLRLTYCPRRSSPLHLTLTHENYTIQSPDGWRFLSVKIKSEVEGVWKEIAESSVCQDGLYPAPRLVYVNESTMCPEVTSSPVSLSPCRRRGFRVVGHVLGSADRVLIRSHSPSVQSQITGAQRGWWKQRGHVCVCSRSYLRFSYR